MTTALERQIDEANSTARPPVVFIHGLWLLPTSWERWEGVFSGAGFTPVVPGWPDDPDTLAEAKEYPKVVTFRGIEDVADHFTDLIGRLERKPAVIGHSLGGLLAEIIAGRGMAEVSVAISPAPPGGVLPLPMSAPLTFDQFRNAFANPLDDDEAGQLYETYAAPVRGELRFQSAAANPEHWTETKVDTENPHRGPLLIIAGEKDHAVPLANANASYDRERRNTGETEIVTMPDRGHALTVDHGWREVAQIALEFVRRVM